jgi:hypothetical protein
VQEVIDNLGRKTLVGYFACHGNPLNPAALFPFTDPEDPRIPVLIWFSAKLMPKKAGQALELKNLILHNFK